MLSHSESTPILDGSLTVFDPVRILSAFAWRCFLRRAKEETIFLIAGDCVAGGVGGVTVASHLDLSRTVRLCPSRSLWKHSGAFKRFNGCPTIGALVNGAFYLRAELIRHRCEFRLYREIASTFCDTPSPRFAMS